MQLDINRWVHGFIFAALFSCTGEAESDPRKNGDAESDSRVRLVPDIRIDLSTAQDMRPTLDAARDMVADLGDLKNHSGGLKAFPKAEGFGKNASGGRGGEVYKVVTLNDDGPGSLRDAVSQPDRTVIFEVAGYINTRSTIDVSKNTTIAGQTAFQFGGQGITVRRDPNNPSGGPLFSSASYSSDEMFDFTESKKYHDSELYSE